MRGSRLVKTRVTKRQIESLAYICARLEDLQNSIEESEVRWEIGQAKSQLWQAHRVAERALEDRKRARSKAPKPAQV